MTDVDMHRCGQLSMPGHSHQYGISAVTGLPEQFVQSMRSLYDILDRDGKGLVPLSEIERQWSDDAVPNLPGALDSLRSIAPQNRMLTFEAFVWGVKASLFRARRLKLQPLASDYGNCRANKDNYFSKHLWYKSREYEINQSLATDGRLPSNGEKKLKSKHRRSNSGPIIMSPSVSSASWSREYLAREKTGSNMVGLAARFSEAPSVSINNNIAGNSLPQQDILENIKLDLSAASPTTFDGNSDLSEYPSRSKKNSENLFFKQEKSQNKESIGNPHIKTSVVKFGSLQRPAMSTPILNNSKKIHKMERRAQQTVACKKEIARKYDFLDDSRHSSITSPRSVPSEEAKSVSEKTPVISNSQIHKEYNREDISPKTRVLSTPVPLARKSREDLGTGILKSQEGSNHRRFEKKKGNYDRKNDIRRHTVASGVNLNVLKCVRKLDVEKSLLLRGVDALDRGRDHILRGLEDVELRRTMAVASGNSGSKFQSISTLTNSQVDSLSGKIDYLEELLQGIMNVQVASADSCNQSDVANLKVAEGRQVKEENKRLIEELLIQSRKIAQLEKEKCLLVQQLFKTKAELHSSTGSKNPLFI